jgi:hypothetical protein
MIYLVFLVDTLVSAHKRQAEAIRAVIKDDNKDTTPEGGVSPWQPLHDAALFLLDNDDGTGRDPYLAITILHRCTRGADYVIKPVELLE